MEAIQCPWTRNPLATGACSRYHAPGDCAACPYNEAVQKKAAPKNQPAKKSRCKAKTPEG
jgi:hypothetical protein